MMTLSILESIERNFGLGSRPTKEELVQFDGFDELDKAHALKLFLGRSTADIARELSQPQSLYGTLTELEDLS